MSTTMTMTTSVGVVGSSYDDMDDELLLEVSSEKIYKQALEIWKEQPKQWNIWKRFARQLTMQHAIYITNDDKKDVSVSDIFRISVTDIVGAMEEGILTLERLEQQQSVGGGGGGRSSSSSSSSSNKEDDEARDSALSVLYTEYGRLLYLSSSLITTTNNNSSSDITEFLDMKLIPSKTRTPPRSKHWN
jgi:hypothetical protein